MGDVNRSIHLVVAQASPKPQPLDAKDIASQVLAVVRECSQALADFHEYEECIIGQMSAELSHLELTALRAGSLPG